MFRKAVSLLGLLVLLAPGAAHAQGLLVNVNQHQQVRLPRPIVIHTHPRIVPEPPTSSYKIKELDVNVRLKDQVARVQVSQSFVNTGSRQMEVCFIFPLPYDGAIDQLTLLVDGQEFPAKLLPAADARRIYEEIVRKNRDPALLEWMGTGMFKTSVFPVPPGAERKVTLNYSQLCRQDRGVTDFLFPLSTAKYTSQPVENVNFRVTIESQIDIKSVYSPTHSIEVHRSGRTATVQYSGKNQVPASDFRLFYDVDPGKLGASVLSYRPTAGEDGYFLLLTTPDIQAADQEPAQKTVVFVVDRSGSMSGPKIEQAKGALKFVLNNLRTGDLFNIVAYDSSVESFRPELQRFDEETRKSALGFVEGLYAGGSTNIDGALNVALKQLQDSSRPTYVVFLTDGLPTAGERGEMQIVANAKQANSVRARIMAFGVGYDVNSRLLDRLVRANYGQSEYVRPDEDIEARVSTLYNKIKSPVMTDLAIQFALDEVKREEGDPINRIYPKEVYDLFEGEQLVAVGRYRKGGAAKVTVTGSVGGREQRFDFPAELIELSSDESYGFIEKLWAVRRVGEIIDELDLIGKNDELIKELVGLSTKHGILTPYTSFLADESTNLRDVASNAASTRLRLRSLDETAGVSGFAQRAAKAELQRATTAAPTPSAAGALGGVVALHAETDEMVLIKTVRNVGNKSFFLRSTRWVDATVTEEMERKATRVVQFSDQYFELAGRHGPGMAKYLAFDEPILVNLDGAAYLIDPAGQEVTVHGFR